MTLRNAGNIDNLILIGEHLCGDDMGLNGMAMIHPADPNLFGTEA